MSEELNVLLREIDACVREGRASLWSRQTEHSVGRDKAGIPAFNFNRLRDAKAVYDRSIGKANRTDIASRSVTP